jgi:hypothetical protein
MARERRRRVARRGSIHFSMSQGANGPQVRRAMQVATTKNDLGDEFDVRRGRQELRIGNGLTKDASGRISVAPTSLPKPTRVAPVRDDSGGTVARNRAIPEVVDVASAADAIATLASWVEEIRKSQ